MSGAVAISLSLSFSNSLDQAEGAGSQDSRERESLFLVPGSSTETCGTEAAGFSASDGAIPAQGASSARKALLSLQISCACRSNAATCRHLWLLPSLHPQSAPSTEPVLQLNHAVTV
uniref:Putative secreted protein n=1 Tax=Ixodes ricinus TaxID=34613 RepID=A0A6B0UM54_IXORI